MTIAKEGWTIVAIVGGLTAFITFLIGASAWPLWLLFLLILQFFRDPKRSINTDTNAVLSPADGRVVFVGPAPSPDDGQETIKISVFMNVFNVHVNRAPVSGQVIHSQRFPGQFFNAILDKSSHHNERHLITIKTDFGHVSCLQIAGLLARRVLCYATVNDSLTAGQRYGFIRFGSRVDIHLPTHCYPTVVIGDKLTAGVNSIAHIPTLQKMD